MLQSRYRLRNRKDIEKVMKRGLRISSDLFYGKMLQSRLSDHRISVVVTTKLDKRAVKRNLVKRRAREVIRMEILASLSETNISDWVIFAKNDPALEHFSFENIKSDLQKLFFNKSKKINNNKLK